ncbi:MAG TPA: response regulator [Candidatus Polarisedimenticolaceae bacterium]|nr:response regulator [Candidatus Polarisedimenticolaceae bacterium]
MKTVLLVDYDPRSIDKIRAALSGIGGVSVVLATDGWSAETEFQRSLPDVTLVQDIIPKKTGYQLCRDLKSTATGARRRVLLLARAHSGNRHRVLNSGCDEWIAKPFDERTLIAVVKKHLAAC